MSYWVYIMTNFGRSTFYIGVTNNIRRRVFEHRQVNFRSFTGRYKCHILVYYEKHQYVLNAIAREKSLKNWHREWKIKMIMEQNPDFSDLAVIWDLSEFEKDPESSSG